MRPLSKRDVEELLHEYDSDPVVALLNALRKILPDGLTEWSAAVHALDITNIERTLLLSHDISALDALAKHLVEFRGLQQ